MTTLKSALLAILLATPLSVSAAIPGLFADWKTPGGSVVRTFSCQQALCMKIVVITPTATGNLDSNNPDSNLRNRPLCNLEIGSSFAIADNGAAATGGRLYDPESGKTYKGNITLNGDTLKLRGYIGVALFGRTEIWRRTTDTPTCR